MRICVERLAVQPLSLRDVVENIAQQRGLVAQRRCAIRVLEFFWERPICPSCARVDPLPTLLQLGSLTRTETHCLWRAFGVRVTIALQLLWRIMQFIDL